MSGCDREQGTHFMCDCMMEKMQSLEKHNAELREELPRVRGIAMSLLEEKMIAKSLQGRYCAAPGKEILVCEKCGKLVTEQVEGILETRSMWELKIAELEEALLERDALIARYENGEEDALSPKAKLENQEEEPDV